MSRYRCFPDLVSTRRTTIDIKKVSLYRYVLHAITILVQTINFDNGPLDSILSKSAGYIHV